MSTDVLGRVVEVVSGDTLADFIRKEISDPLGMVDTHFTVPSQKCNRVVSAYVRLDGKLQKLESGRMLDLFGRPLSSDFHLGLNNCLSGGGGMCSTASDYMRFSMMLLNGGKLGNARVLSAEAIRMMTSNQVDEPPIPGVVDEFGLGLAVLPDAETVHGQLRGAYSWGGFWSTFFRVSPRGDWIVVAMAQTKSEEVLDWYNRYEEIAAESIID
jgi:CubicO group peptidase (beta-lactamase class C family)